MSEFSALTMYVKRDYAFIPVNTEIHRDAHNFLLFILGYPSTDLEEAEHELRMFVKRMYAEKRGIA